MTDRQILLAKIFLFSQPYGYFMDTIKSFCTEQNQTDVRHFDTGITVIFVMQNLLFWKWWIFPWFSRPSVSYGVFPIPVRKKKKEAEWRNVGVLNENIISCWCCINLLNLLSPLGNKRSKMLWFVSSHAE